MTGAPDSSTGTSPRAAPDRAAPDRAVGHRGPGAMRASDADRERVAERLRTAAVDGRLDMDELDDRLGAAYRARTYDDLAGLTSDLPGDDAPVPVPADRSGRALPMSRSGAEVAPRRTAGAVTVPRVVPGPERGAAVAVFSGASRTGRWTVPEQLAVVAVMGGVELDLRAADLAAHEVTLTVFALMGGVQITVPDGVNVRADGIGLLGGFDSAGAHAAGPDAPTVVVRGVAVMGGVEVRRRPAKSPRELRSRG